MRFSHCGEVVVLVSGDRSLPKGRILLWLTVRVRLKDKSESKGEVEGKGMEEGLG